MKNIILMRHAKSSWSNPTDTDKDRPLNGRGRRAAELMGKWLAENDLQPDHAIVSAAQRTRETWQGIAPNLAPPATGVEVKDALYLAGPDLMLELLRATPEDAASVLMIAHQPGTGALAQLLSGAEICAGCESAFHHFPTASVATLEAAIESWRDLGFGTSAFRRFVCPKDLG